MKNWLRAAGRFLAIFLLSLILLVGIAALAASPRGLGFSGLLSLLEAATRRFLPVAAAAAIFLGAHGFVKRRRIGAAGLFSLLILGSCLLFGGFGLRRFLSEPSLAQAPPTARPGLIADTAQGAFYLDALEAGQARGLVVFSPAAAPEARLGYTAAAGYDPSTGRVDLGGRSLLPLAKEAEPELGDLPLRAGRLLADRYAGIDALPLPLAALMLGALALLATGLAGLSTLPRWSLVGLFFSVGGLLALLVFDGALVSARARELFEPLPALLGLGTETALFLPPAIEALLGLAFFIPCLIGAAREEE
jgi:hypothetical protein